MESIYNSLSLNKTNNSYYKKYKFKYKINFISIIILIISLIPVVFAVIFNMYYLIFITALIITIDIFYYRRVVTKRKMKYCNFLASKLQGEATEKNMLLLNEIYPLFLNVNDEEQLFEIYYDNNIILKTTYENIKNYKIYNTSKKYKEYKRLPDIPKDYIKKYIIEINFKDNNSIDLEFYNNNLKFVVGNKAFYQQNVNTKTINALALILDKIFEHNKKINRK